jgi:hypothetical protein
MIKMAADGKNFRGIVVCCMMGHRNLYRFKKKLSFSRNTNNFLEVTAYVVRRRFLLSRFLNASLEKKDAAFQFSYR